jgi:MATE family multidrug resistance protein
MTRLAVPVVLAELGWMTMGLVDVMMVGRVGAEAIGAVSVGVNVFFAVAIFGIGMLLGLDFLVARAFGAGRLDEAHRALHHGLVLALPFTAGLTVVLLAAIPHLEAIGIRPEVARAAEPYLLAQTWSLGPLLVYFVFQRYLQAIGQVRPVMLAFLSANVVNALADWIFIFGNLGLPALGAEGAGWATFASRVYLTGALGAYTFWHARREGTGLLETTVRIERARLFELARLGFPAAVQRVLEVGVFVTAALLAGRLEPAALAAHQLALTAAGFTFMVPLGVSSAAAIRVGHFLGAGDLRGAGRAGWTALFLGAAFMTAAGLTFVTVPGVILRAFTTDPAVIATGMGLLAVAALFQLFDGVQVVATGALRGIGDTRTPAIANLVAHWLVGLPIGYALCFWYERGVVGLWIGLCLGLVVVALWLTGLWSRRVANLNQAPDETAPAGEKRGYVIRGEIEPAEVSIAEPAGAVGVGSDAKVDAALG